MALARASDHAAFPWDQKQKAYDRLRRRVPLLEGRPAAPLPAETSSDPRSGLRAGGRWPPTPLRGREGRPHPRRSQPRTAMTRTLRRAAGATTRARGSSVGRPRPGSSCASPTAPPSPCSRAAAPAVGTSAGRCSTGACGRRRPTLGVLGGSGFENAEGSAPGTAGQCSTKSAARVVQNFVPARALRAWIWAKDGATGRFGALKFDL